jgi:hypothetical protein
MMIRRLTLLSLVVAASSAGAQSAFDVQARIAPQYHSYDIKSPSNTKISELAIPLFVVVPVTARLSFDIGTSFTSVDVEQTAGGTSTKSTISGLTDTQLRGNYTIGSDFVVLTAGLNLPTGQSKVNEDQLTAASLIGNDFLAFPISNMGTGFGGTGGIAIARPIGEWSVGAGASVRHSASYDPFNVNGSAFHYQPGNEYRIRGGVDRAFGTGRINLGLTYSSFGDDDLAGSVYNTGNRWLTQVGMNNNFGPGMLTFAAWDLYRPSGEIADFTDSTSIATGKENILAASLAYGIQTGSTTIIEPNVEGRVWSQPSGIPSSTIATVGLRSQFSLIGYAVSPSVGYSFGRLGTGSNAVTATSDLTGFHATIAIRLR